MTSVMAEEQFERFKKLVDEQASGTSSAEFQAQVSKALHQLGVEAEALNQEAFGEMCAKSSTQFNAEETAILVFATNVYELDVDQLVDGERLKGFFIRGWTTMGEWNKAGTVSRDVATLAGQIAERHLKDTPSVRANELMAGFDE